MANLKTKYVTMGCEFVDAELLREAVELLKDISRWPEHHNLSHDRKTAIDIFIKKATE